MKSHRAVNVLELEDTFLSTAFGFSAVVAHVGFLARIPIAYWGSASCVSVHSSLTWGLWENLAHQAYCESGCVSLKFWEQCLVHSKCISCLYGGVAGIHRNALLSLMQNRWTSAEGRIIPLLQFMPGIYVLSSRRNKPTSPWSEAEIS